MFIAQVFTLYPDCFPGPLDKGLYGKAIEKKIWDLKIVDIREYASDKHKTVDDTPYGGGNGMLIKADVLAKSLDENIKEKEDGADKNKTQKSELELLEERDENSLTEEEEDRMYELRRLRAQKRINDEVRDEEQAEFKKADEEIAHLKTLLKPKKKKLPKGYVE